MLLTTLYCYAMDRRSFLNKTWNGNIKPILIFAILIFIAAILVNVDFKNGLRQTGGIFTAMVQILIFAIVKTWKIVLLILSPFLLSLLLLRVLPVRYHTQVKKAGNVALYLILAGFIAWVSYNAYRDKNYYRLLWMAVLLAVTIRGLMKDRKTRLSNQNTDG